MKIFSLEIFSNEILQHENFPIYGIWYVALGSTRELHAPSAANALLLVTIGLSLKQTDWANIH